uniref:Retrovirus-related Pol polyprotein from transposon 297 family n=1 Tax=Cajanus cajan TaxID=3821 RepID=A0A151TDV9_CAJCA|nr:Retrovirus-related Pol polyprotein from transposon 297 family [Cajanus cajan]
MCLNPEKCVFGVQGGKFIGFMITSRGIEANPEKCKAIIQMQSPQTVKDVQRLAGRLVSLSHFIPRLAEKVGPIFTLLRKLKNFEWTNQCEKAFKNFKVFLTTLPVLQRPDYHVDLLLYLVMAEGAISAVIVQEHQKVQTPIYFISQVLQDTEKWYQMIEKLALALVTAARRLRPYFQSHQVVVKIDYPIKQILRKLELSERMIPLTH